jgi:hypothetical protein
VRSGVGPPSFTFTQAPSMATCNDELVLENSAWPGISPGQRTLRVAV